MSCQDPAASMLTIAETEHIHKRTGWSHKPSIYFSKQRTHCDWGFFMRNGLLGCRCGAISLWYTGICGTLSHLQTCHADLMDQEFSSLAATQSYLDVAQCIFLLLSGDALGYLASETILKPKRMTGGQDDTQRFSRAYRLMSSEQRRCKPIFGRRLQDNCLSERLGLSSCVARG
jgi:hypothetical protein